MTFSSLLRSTRADINRMLWRWTLRRPPPVIVTLQSRRAQLRAGHRSTKAIDARIREERLAMLRREMAK